MTVGTARPSSTLPAEPTEETLSATELYRLTLFKWRYGFEARGFSDYEVDELVFLKWLHFTRRVRP